MIPGWIAEDLHRLGLTAELVAVGQGGTWLLRAGSVWIKAHRSPRKLAQERAAYLQVVPALAGAGFRVPVLLRAEGRLLVLSHLPGQPVEPGAPHLHRQAGALLAFLHRLPCDDADPLALADALALRGQRWLSRARPYLPAPLHERARSILADASLFSGEARRWCHRDLAPRNWLDHHGVLGLVDFEHARPDHPLMDLVKLVDESWRSDPELRGAFFEGYGALEPAEGERLAWLLWLHGVATTAWAAEHHDAAGHRRGQALLDQLAASSSAAISSALW